MNAPLAADIARCAPSCVCPKIRHCARFRVPRKGSQQVIDASVTLRKPGAICGLFIDVRRPALQEAAA